MRRLIYIVKCLVSDVVTSLQNGILLTLIGAGLFAIAAPDRSAQFARYALANVGSRVGLLDPLIAREREMQAEKQDLETQVQELRSQLPTEIDMLEAIEHVSHERGIDYVLLLTLYQKESGGDIYAIGNNGGRSVDLGPMQINSTNLARLQLTPVDAFHPLRAVDAAATILWECRLNADRIKVGSCMGNSGTMLRLEYLFRCYNGGEAFYKSATEYQQMTCDYARDAIQRYVSASLKPFDRERAEAEDKYIRQFSFAALKARKKNGGEIMVAKK